jgi:hypothetical protein
VASADSPPFPSPSTKTNGRARHTAFAEWATGSPRLQVANMSPGLGGRVLTRRDRPLDPGYVVPRTVALRADSPSRRRRPGENPSRPPGASGTVCRVIIEFGNYQLDDEPTRVDRDAVWSFLSSQAYWGRWRTRQDVAGWSASPAPFPTESRSLTSPILTLWTPTAVRDWVRSSCVS